MNRRFFAFALAGMYCPPGRLQPAFTYPTTQPTFISMAMEIAEVLDTPASVAAFVGDGINADLLSASTIRLGQAWDAALAIGHPHGVGGPMSLRVRNGTTNGANVTSPIGGRTTEVLIQGRLLATLTGTHDGTSGSFPSVAVPKSIGLLCRPWAAQATVLGGGFADLSSAATGVVGTE